MNGGQNAEKGKTLNASFVSAPTRPRQAGNGHAAPRIGSLGRCLESAERARTAPKVCRVLPDVLPGFCPGSGRVLPGFWPSSGRVLPGFWPSSGRVLPGFWRALPRVLMRSPNPVRRRLVRGAASPSGAPRAVPAHQDGADARAPILLSSPANSRRMLP